MENNTTQKESKKSLFDNVFFVSFLFIIALADLIYRAIHGAANCCLITEQ